MSTEPTRQQIDAAHSAWEATASEWTLRKIVGGLHDVWVLESCGDGRYDPSRVYSGDEPAAHRFDGPNAERTARYAWRDKALTAAIAAALNCA